MPDITASCFVIGEKGHTGVDCAEVDFLTFPAEIRNKIYDLITYERLHQDYKYDSVPKAPLPVPMSDELLELRLVSRHFSIEIVARMFTWGAALRLNMIPQPRSQKVNLVDVRVENEVARKSIRGTCSIGTANVAADLGFRLRLSRSLTASVPPALTNAWNMCHFQLILRHCRYSERCNACRSYRWERVSRVKFALEPTLDELVRFHKMCLPRLPLIDIIITQEENWLTIGGKKLLAVGEEEDLVVSMEPTEGHALEWYLRTTYHGLNVRVTVKTLSNLEREYFDL